MALLGENQAESRLIKVNQGESSQIKPNQACEVGSPGRNWTWRWRRRAAEYSPVKPAFARSQTEDQGYSAEVAKERQDRPGG
jgi:hypothetical protein